MRDATLAALARLPLLAADDLALLRGVTVRGARRALEARVAAREAGFVVHPATRVHLYHLTRAGVVAAAPFMGDEPRRLEARYGLGQAALLRRLPALDRLVVGRAVLVRLATALAAEGGALEDWCAFPVRWPFERAGRREMLVLDGEATLRFPDGVRCTVGYLWDGDPDVPDGALREHLDLLAGARACPLYALPYAARVPPVLVVTGSRARIPPGYRPGILHATTKEIVEVSPLTAGWCDTATMEGRDQGLPIREALDHIGLLSPRPTPASRLTVAVNLAAPVSPATLLNLTSRVIASPTAEPKARDVLVLALALPPRARPLLRCIGQHTLLRRRDLAVALGCDPSDTWELLRLLRDHGLCRGWQPTAPGTDRAWRFSLTTRATELLARAQALTPTAYRRADGVLDDALRSGEHGLDYARENLAHTDGINAIYLSFLVAARARGGALRWRGEWACARKRGTEGRSDSRKGYSVRPDAELWYDGLGGTLHAFLEYDRSTSTVEDLANKVDRYADYRTDSGDHCFTVLLITGRPDRANKPLARAHDLPYKRRLPSLDLRAATLIDLRAQGPWAPIWRDTYGSISTPDRCNQSRAGTSRDHATSGCAQTRRVAPA